ncbi:MAG: hypothetical protein JWM28_2434 [Chitinophagaceae bacterium]|nr:hypothetical protein [Chitinophagaceae bacterium]
MKEFLSRLFQHIMKGWTWALLIALAIIIKVISSYPALIERDYTYGVYPIISSTQRFLFGWLPISLGDLFYSFIILWLIVKAGQLVKAIFKRRITRSSLLKGLQQFIFICLFIYVAFNLLWGLNYNRVGIASQLGLEMKKYNLRELDTLTAVLQKRLNEYVVLADPQQRDSFYKKRNLFRESFEAYHEVAKQYSFLSYYPQSIKPSIFSYVGNVLGFSGYYNPFSGEAQVNTTVPVFTQPFIACHEIGHQLGYGKENEANFAGFLACRAHPLPAFRYSVYFDMYNYTINELYRRDSVAAKAFVSTLSPLVKKDFKELRAFYDKYENPMEPVITWLYGNYLKANRQPAGRQTYNQVVAFLIAYQKKFGKDSL